MHFENAAGKRAEERIEIVWSNMCVKRERAGNQKYKALSLALSLRFECVVKTATIPLHFFRCEGE